MRIAVLSDIHGNTFALEAVLADIESRNIDQIFNLGDILYGPLDPAGTFKLIQANKMISISGNQDRIILNYFGKEPPFKTLEYVWDELDEDAFSFLESLPFDYKYPEGIYLCHATPQKDDEYLLEKLYETHVGVKQNDEIEEILKSVEQHIVVCGHSHQARIVKTSAKTIINPGSVGLPAYDDDLPIFHKMESFSPNAKYCIVTVDGKEKIAVEQISLPYNFEAAAKLAEKNNRPDWAKWIRTGRA